MVSIAENKAIWEGRDRWGEAGDDWSAPWGSVQMQWHGTLLPRIHRMLPAQSIVEIACGHGRWTQFLSQQCDRLVGVDLSRRCVDACIDRFGHNPKLSFVQNDGTSLAMIPDESADLIFSFDSLVHVDVGVLKGYLSQFRRILKRNGTAFIHHSNRGDCSRFHPQRIPKVRFVLWRMKVLEFPHLRDLSVSAAKVDQICRENGLSCISQELTTWLTRRTYIDCFSTIVRSDSPKARDNVVFRNPHFYDEVQTLSSLSSLYR